MHNFLWFFSSISAVVVASRTSCGSEEGILLLQLRSSNSPGGDVGTEQSPKVEADVDAGFQALHASEANVGGSVQASLKNEARDAFKFDLNLQDPSAEGGTTDRIIFVWFRNHHDEDVEGQTGSQSSGPKLAGTSMKTSTRVSYNGVPVVIENSGGNFGGSEVFLDAVFKNLDAETVQQLNQCALGFKGDQHLPAGSGNVWIIVNAEDPTGEAIAQHVSTRVGPQDRVLVLGNLWNEDTKEDIIRDGRVTSMWIPFASLNFAERKRHTPMDLYDRSRIQLNRPKKGTVAYQQRNCGAALREKVFTQIDDKLRMTDLDPASALSDCHGIHEQESMGYTNENGAHCDSTCGIYDQSVGRYEDFKFVLTMEHEETSHNSYGYITEKIVNAFLAGAIPISDSSVERAEVFKKETYIAVDATDLQSINDAADKVVELLRDPDEYEQVLREPVLTGESLRRFFSWHPAVWPSHGDTLRQRIVDEVLRLCGTN